MKIPDYMIGWGTPVVLVEHDWRTRMGVPVQHVFYVGHDDDCSLLTGLGACSCEPDIEAIGLLVPSTRV